MPADTPQNESDFDLLSVLSRGRILLLALAALALAFFPVLVRYFPQLWAREYYQFFPFAIGITVGFAVVRCDPVPRFGGKSFRWSLRAVPFVLALVALAWAAIRSPSPLTYYIAFAALVALLLDFFVEQSSGRPLTYLAIPFLLTVRPPGDRDVRIIQKLQSITSSIASQFLNTLQLDHILDGNTIIPMNGSALLVAEACSGVQSLFTLMFIASVIGVYHRYPMLRILLLTVSAVFWALLMNVSRVMSIAVAQISFQTDLTTGWKHDLVGYSAMLLAIPFLLSTDRLLQFFFGPIPDDPRKHQKINVLVMGWNWLLTASSEVLETPAEIAERLRRLPEWSALQSGRRLILTSLAALSLLATLPAWRLLLSASEKPETPPAQVTAQTAPPELTL
ncbi:MAG: exosortase/archaeosortase family protein [Planctomycetaceae bacterium]